MPILIRTKTSRRGEPEPSVPYVPDNFDRFEEFKARLRNVERVAQGNNYPWKWRVKPKS